MEEHYQRKHPRVQYPCQLTMWTAEGYDTVLAQTSDIGLGGIGLQLNQEIAVRTKVDIGIDFNDSAASFRCKGVVVRCQPLNNRTYDIGIQFEHLSAPNHEFLDGKISKLMRSEKKGNP